jgi:hypothetical protein
MFNHLITLGAAAALAAALPIVAPPVTASAHDVAFGDASPVSIDHFGINESYDSGMRGNEAAAAPQFIVTGIGITFVNTGNVNASAVTFVVTAGKATERIVDRGSFSPGTRIVHTYTADDGIAALPDAQVRVAGIDFADGTSWRDTPRKTAAR